MNCSEVAMKCCELNERPNTAFQMTVTSRFTIPKHGENDREPLDDDTGLPTEDTMRPL
jgi:hypothetical protein